MKTPVLWITANVSKMAKVIQIQAFVRGWLVRKRLSLAGPGVLSRKASVNDEDFVTCERKERKHPYEYFALEEDGKIWWFDFESLWKWSIQSAVPTNPYTRTPLTADTRKRLREICNYQLRTNGEIPAESEHFTERIQQRWNLLCQTFRDNGFVEIRPDLFLTFTKSEYISMFILLRRDIETVFSDKDPHKARAIRSCKRVVQLANTESLHRVILYSTYVLVTLLSLHKDPYVMVFSIMSALYRC
jgi:hypothetical protein